jgi:trk system potassium uptake protein TrkA
MSIPGIQIVCGDGTDVNFLEEEAREHFDAFISVTGNSETNIFSCLVAKDMGIKKTVAMVENIGLFEHSQRIGIDTLINKKLATANFIFRLIQPDAFHAFLYGIDAEVIEFKIGINSKASNRLIKEIGFPEHAIICAVERNNIAVIPDGSFAIKPEDRVLVLTLPEEFSKVERFFNK